MKKNRFKSQELLNKTTADLERLAVQMMRESGYSVPAANAYRFVEDVEVLLTQDPEHVDAWLLRLRVEGEELLREIDGESAYVVRWVSAQKARFTEEDAIRALPKAAPELVQRVIESFLDGGLLVRAPLDPSRRVA